MMLFLEILTGPMAGNKYKITDGLSIGRKHGEILLENDVKVSGSHGKISFDEKGVPVLKDLGSSNAFILNERRVRKIVLTPGIYFRVGNTDFAVKTEADASPGEVVDLSTWQDKVERLLSEAKPKPALKSKKIQTFTPMIQLEFLQGVQAEKRLNCGYGPRAAGSGQIDIDLMDPEAPEKCFQLIPGPGLAYLEDQSQGRVLINEQVPDKKQALKDGDLIQIGSTIIKIYYL